MVAILLLALAIPLVAGELGVRGLIAFDRLPEAPSQDDWLEISLLNTRRGEPIDILLSGDSLMRNDVDPAVLAERVASETGESLRIHNLAQLGLDFLNQRVMLEDLEDHGRLPRVVVIGISTSQLQDREGTNLQQFVRSTMGGLISDCDYMVGLDETLDCRLSQVSALWRWHGRPHRILGAIRRPVPRSAQRLRGSSMRADGFVEMPPKTVAQIAEDVPQAVADQSNHLLPHDETIAQYGALVAYLRDRGVQVVTVALPYSPLLSDAMLAVNPAWNEERRAALDRFEAAGGMPIIRTEGFGAWWGDGSSTDPKHLSREGAPLFVDQLWADPSFRRAILDAVAESGDG